MIAYLECPDGRRVEVPSAGTLVIGRIAACDVQIDDPKASRRHAQLIADHGVCEVEDLGSSNGTLLNGNPVQKRVVRPGDVIQIGATQFTFREGAAPAVGGEAGAGADSRSGAAALDEDDLFADVDLMADAGAPPTARAPSVSPPPSEPERQSPPRVVPPPTPAATRPPVSPPPERPAIVDDLADELGADELEADELSDDAFADVPVAPPQFRPSAPNPSPPARSATPPAAPRLDPDELVVTRRAAAKPAESASADPTRRASAPAAGADRASAGRSTHGVLQFSQRRGGGGALSDDVSQTGGLTKLWIVLGAIAFAAAVAYGAMVLGRG